MSDWKENLKKLNAYKGGGGGMKKCSCGNKINNERFDTCFACSKKKKAESNGHDNSGKQLPDDYLKNGYFDNNNCLREELLTSSAENIARIFTEAYPKMQNHQLRRFYQHIRAADNKLTMTGDWPCVNVDVKKLASFAAEAKGKNKVPDVFNEFIKKNVDCVDSEHSFQKGFLEHFQAVVAYFTYFKPRD